MSDFDAEGIDGTRSIIFDTQTARSKPIAEVISMNRRELLKRSAALGLTAAGSLTLPGEAAATFDAARESAALNPAYPSRQRVHSGRFPDLRRCRRY